MIYNTILVYINIIKEIYMRNKEIMWKSRHRDAVYRFNEWVIIREDIVSLVKTGKTNLDCDIIVNDEKIGETRLYQDTFSINIGNKMFQGCLGISTCNTTKWNEDRIKETSEKIKKYVLEY